MAARKKKDETEPAKAAETAKAEETEEVALTQNGVLREYLAVYHRCMEEDPKTFDAKGALNALDQISRILGLDQPIQSADVDGNRVVLTLAEPVGGRGD